MVFSPTALRINEMFVVDLTSVVGENTNNGEPCECTNIIGLLADQTKLETAALGVSPTAFRNNDICIKTQLTIHS